MEIYEGFIRISQVIKAGVLGILVGVSLSANLYANEVVPISGRGGGDMGRRIDELMVEFIKANKVPGASLCIAKDGEIVYSKGFGYADVEAAEPVTTMSRFRIGSISKTLTAVTILVLADKNMLELNDRVFSILDYEPFVTGDKKVDERIYSISVLHLLQHTSGWDAAETFDPTGRILSIGREMKLSRRAKSGDVIRYMMGRPLQHAPGTRYAYSNFGYAVLGKVIEKKTGLRYTEAVKEYVLEPLGLAGISPGRTWLENRAADEVIYYDSEKRTMRELQADGTYAYIPYPYRRPLLEEFTSVGGWISNAEDLVKFALVFDDAGDCELLRPYYVRRMFAMPQNSVKWFDEDRKLINRYSYACGWKVKERGKDKYDLWHHGSLPGTSAGLGIYHNGYAYAVLFNGRNNEKGEKLSYIFSAMLSKTLPEIKKWSE